MNEFLESSLWAVDSRYFGLNHGRIIKMIEAGQVDIDLAKETKAHRPVLRYALSNDGILDKILGKSIQFESQAQYEAARTGAAATTGTRIAIVPVSGPMTKNGGMCSYGTRDIGAWLTQANSDPEVGAIVLAVDSPGGSVDGTEELANLVKGSAKPVVAYLDGLGASAAYWTASQASEIFISSETTAFAGSIGTLIQHVDQSAALESAGIKVRFITADKSTHKVLGNGTEPLSEEAIAMFKSQLNAINDTFEAAVRSGRGDKLSEKEDVFTAKVYNGRDAKKAGLVDKVGTIDDAVRRAAQLANQSKNSNNSNLNNSNQETMKFNMSAFPVLGAALVALKLIPDANAEIGAQDAITHAEAALKASNDAKAAVDAQLATAIQEKTTLKATVDQNVKDIEAKNGEIATLEDWKKNAAATGAKGEDESNKNDPSAGADLADYEKIAMAEQSRIKGRK